MSRTIRDGVLELLGKWDQDERTYPNTEIGQYCSAVLRLCIKELVEVYNSSEE